jgi:hypothetical protein
MEQQCVYLDAVRGTSGRGVGGRERERERQRERERDPSNLTGA